MSNELAYNASCYIGEGISVTYTDQHKVSILPWKQFQQRLMTEDEIEHYKDKASGLAIICGHISQGLEVIDIDSKYDPSGKLFETLMEQIGSLIDKLTISKTIGGGYHLYYRCDIVEGNQKLANRYATDAELESNPHQKQFVLIETRGDGGYVVAPPSPGYSWLQGDTTSIQVITPSERENLHSICWSMNEVSDVIRHQPNPVNDKSYGLTPLDDYNQRGDTLKLLTDNGWAIVRTQGNKVFLRRPGKTEGTSGDYLTDKKWFSVFTTSSEFEPLKAYSPAAVFCMLKCGGDWSKTARQLASYGFGQDNRSYQSKKNATKIIRDLKSKGFTLSEVLSQFDKSGSVNHKEVEQIFNDSSSDTDDIGEFWDIDKNNKVTLDYNKLMAFIESLGFSKMAYNPEGTDLRIIREQDKLIEESTIEIIKMEVGSYVRERSAVVMNHLLKHPNFINESFIELLNVSEPNFITDTKDKAFFPFQNGIVEVNKIGIRMITYSDLDGVFWKKQKKDFIINLRSDEHQFFTQDNDGYVWNHLDKQYGEHNDFPDFIRKISGTDQNFQTSVSILGYLTHTFKDPANPRVVILAEEADHDNKGGGTGKGLFTNAVMKMQSGIRLDGKTFRTDKSFALQQVSPDTRIISIDDIPKGFQFEQLYSMITEGIPVEKKGKDQYHIPYSKSPKFIITTNHTMDDMANHAKRRMVILYFSDYFGLERTPLTQYGKMLFDEWTKEEWDVFYNFMFSCVRFFFIQGLVITESGYGVKIKAIRQRFGDDLKDYVLELFEARKGHVIEFKAMFVEFLDRSGNSEKDYSQKRFEMGLMFAAQAFNMNVEKIRSSQTGRKSYKFVPDDSATSEIYHSESRQESNTYKSIS